MKENMEFDPVMKRRVERIEQLRKKIESGKTDELLVETHFLYSLIDVTRSISVSQNFSKLLEQIVDSAISLTNAERGFLMLFSEDGNLEFEVNRNIDRAALEGDEFEVSRTVVNRVLATGESLFLSDIYKDRKFVISKSIEALGLRMIMCVPLRGKEDLLGVIYVDSHTQAERLTKLEEKMFEAFAAQASITIENNRLFESSVHDALTGLYNYGYLHARLEEEVTRVLRSKGGSISFIMIDVDRFKSINDSYGHLYGNSVLMKVADVIRKSVRRYDIAARYGGDEFAILMPDADMRDARFLAERLQKEITDFKFSIGQQTFSISLSIGISTFPAEQIGDGENIFIEADNALLVAKNKGGNQIAIFDLRKDENKQELRVIGKSKTIEQVRETISKLAKINTTILIAGETGTGKDLIVSLVHHTSVRAKKPLVVVNCGAIPDNLLESELFGYEKGAFTGAYAQRKGKFELAHGGTIFLDEVGELPLHLQVKILRTIEEKEVDRIGSKSPIKVDVRVIAATNKNLESEIKNGNFRKDLFYRLSVATIYVPPLRERPEDIEVLTDYYLSQLNNQYHKKILGVTRAGKETMMHYSWPGNVRELIHRIERAVIMATGQYLDENDLGLTSTQWREELKPLRESRDRTEKESIMQALTCHRWNITRASKSLGISQKALRHLMKKHQIAKPSIHK